MKFRECKWRPTPSVDPSPLEALTPKQEGPTKPECQEGGQSCFVFFPFLVFSAKECVLGDIFQFLCFFFMFCFLLWILMGFVSSFLFVFFFCSCFFSPGTS